MYMIMYMYMIINILLKIFNLNNKNILLNIDYLNFYTIY